MSTLRTALAAAIATALVAPGARAQLAVKARTLHTMTEQGTIADGVVLIGADGRIERVGPAGTTPIPANYRVLDASVATPGLIDAHATVGVSGLLNQRQDQDQLETSGPVQPELRAIDAYNPNDRLVEWVRSFGVTTLHTGHAPGELISGQTCIVKTRPGGADDVVIVETATIAATLGPQALRDGAPGTRAKEIAMLRDEFIKAREYLGKKARPPEPGAAENEKSHDPDARDLRREALARVLRREIPLMVTCHKAQDIASALRLAREFDLRLILDGGTEAPLLAAELVGAGVPVIVHPPMMRAYGELENASMATPGRLADAGLLVALQGGYESYVPKARVVLFEAGVAASRGLGSERALAAVTINAARILGIDARVGSLAQGKDGDVALYDGDPLEYTTHCVGVVIEGKVVSEQRR